MGNPIVLPIVSGIMVNSLRAFIVGNIMKCFLNTVLLATIFVPSACFCGGDDVQLREIVISGGQQISKKLTTVNELTPMLIASPSISVNECSVISKNIKLLACGHRIFNDYPQQTGVSSCPLCLSKRSFENIRNPYCKYRERCDLAKDYDKKADWLEKCSYGGYFLEFVSLVTEFSSIYLYKKNECDFSKINNSPCSIIDPLLVASMVSLCATGIVGYTCSKKAESYRKKVSVELDEANFLLLVELNR
jgi:hypothetical protein